MAEELNQGLPEEDNLPLDLEASGADLPLDLEVGSRSDSPASMEHMHKGQAAALKAYNEDKNLIQAFAEIEGDPNPRQLKRQLASQKTDADIQDLLFALEGNPGGSELEIVENTLATDELIGEAQEAGDNPAKQVVDAASTLETDPEIAAKIENQLRIMEDIQDMMQDYSGLDIAWDVVKGLMPGKLIVDNLALTGSLLGSEEIMRDMIIGFKSLSAEEQAEAWPALREEILEELPTNRALPLLMSFIDPVGEEQLEDFNAFWATVDTVDVAALGAGVALRMATLSKKLNAVKMLSDLKNKENAADVGAAAIIDDTGKTSEAANIDRVTAYNNAMPFDVSDIDDAYAGELSTKIIGRIEKAKANQREVVDNIINEESFIKEDLVSDAERAAAEAEYVKDLTENGFENISVVGRTSGATNFKYDLVMDGETLSDVGRMDLTISDVTGTFEQAPEAVLKNWVTSPSVFLKGTAKEAFDAAARLDSTSSKISKQLMELQREAVKPITGKTGLNTLIPGGSARQQLAEVDTILTEGSNAGKLYSPVELKAGVNGVSLNDNQIETYYNVRNLYDNLWVIRNAGERQKMVSQGMKEVGLTRGPQVGRVHESLQSAQAHINLNTPSKIWKDDTGQVIFLKDVNLKKLYEQGYVLTNLREPLRIGKEGDHFKTVLARRIKTGDLPERVMHYREGYVPRINKNAYWFAKDVRNTMVDGKLVEGGFSKTLRFFSSKSEAQKWGDEFKANNPDVNLSILEDREMESQILGSSNIGSGGGLYTGARSTDPIPFGSDGRPAETFGAFEALSRNINAVQNFTSRNAWRLGLQQKWINSAKAAGFKNVDRFDSRLVPDETTAGRGLKKMAEQIEIWSGFPTKSELMWDSLVSDSMEWALNKGADPKWAIVRGTHNLRHKDPIAGMRAISFHSLLGVFNPVQLWVQAQGASVALSVATKLDDPFGAARAVKNQFALQLANKAEKGSKTRANIAKAAAIDVKDLDEMVDLWRMSGLEDSILKTSDHAASSTGSGIGADALSRAADKGLFFYRAGELINRRTSFLVALDEFKTASKTGKVDNDAMKGILTRANNMMLNLSKANGAAWQRGPASLPTQFMQVQAKILESLLGANGSFTGAERAKIMLGQLGLYGAAGIPMLNFAVRWVSEMLGVDQADIEASDPELVKAVNEGFWGWLAMSAFSADVELGARGGVASGLEQFLFDVMYTEAPITEKMMGAFGTVPSRFFQAYRDIKPLAMGSVARKEFPDQQSILRAASHLASITSTWSNFQKGYFMQRFDRILDRNNVATVIGEFNLGTEVATMIGFQPSDQRRARDLQAMNKELKEYRTATVATMLSTYWDYTKTIEAAESEREKEEVRERYEDIHAVILQSLPTDNDRRLVREAFMQKVTAGEGKLAKGIKLYMKNFNDGRLADLHSIKSTFVTKGLIRTGVLDEEE